MISHLLLRRLNQFPTLPFSMKKNSLLQYLTRIGHLISSKRIRTSRLRKPRSHWTQGSFRKNGTYLWASAFYRKLIHKARYRYLTTASPLQYNKWLKNLTAARHTSWEKHRFSLLANSHFGLRNFKTPLLYLDFILFNSQFVSSLRQARKLIADRLVIVNGRIAKRILTLKKGDIISILRTKSALTRTYHAIRYSRKVHLILTPKPKTIKKILSKGISRFRHNTHNKTIRPIPSRKTIFFPWAFRSNYKINYKTLSILL